MSWFETKNAKIRKSHIKDMIGLAAADGHIDQKEIEFICMIAIEWGVSEKELNELFNSPQKVKFNIPQTDAKRWESLLDLVYLMIIDGEIHEKEMIFCISIATALGISPTVIPIIIDSFKNGINGNKTRSEILEEQNNRGNLF